MRRSCSQARWARPSLVFCTSAQKATSSTAVTTKMRNCFSEIVTVPPPSGMVITSLSMGGTGLLRGPCATCTKFDRKIDMPMAEISGASRNEPASGR